MWTSLACALILCIGVFVWITAYMVSQSGETIHEVGTIYMSQMSTQLKLQFSLFIDSRVAQMEELVGRTAAGDGDAGRQSLDEVKASARGYDYTYLGLYDEDGNGTALFGEDIEIIDEDAFLDGLRRDEKKVAAAKAQSGEELILLGVPAVYQMEDGGRSAALVAGLPMKHIEKNLSLDIGETLVYSHFIRKDGTFILRNADATEDSYFERVLSYGQSPNQTPQKMLRDIERAIANGADHSIVLTIHGEKRSTYFSPLPYSDWYLVSVMPYGTLEEPIMALNGKRIATTLAGCGVITIVLLFLFFLYFRMSQQQMAALDEARKKADSANRSKSEFLSNMSHDIRTPMNAIVGMTSIAKSNLDDAGRVQNCLQKIELSSKHLLGLINDVLDMSKIESGKLTLNMDRLSLREVVDSIVNIVQPQIKEKHQQFDVFIQDVDVEDVYCDGVRLNQVLINLLSNAIKFTPAGGTIYLSLRQEPSPAGESFVRLHFYVKDTGIGMSKAFQERLFEAFERENCERVNKTEGTGLGMAISKYIVDAMQGRIEVHSEPGAGSEFHVTLDLEKALIQVEDMRLPPWKILIVDDDKQICEDAASILREMGADAQWTLDGESALTMAQERHRAGDDYEIILLDWNMPGLSGLETALQFRQQIGGTIPILLISAYEWNHIEQEARRAGVSGFVAKPLFKSTLFYALNHYMGIAPEEMSSPEKEMQMLSGKRILLAEDNDLNWEIADALLTQLGLVIERAENGRVCVEKFRRSEPGSYDGILMDIRMPEMDGYEATKAIRAASRPDADIPIIAMTADAFTEDIQRCLACGMNDHITKPIDIAIVIQTLQKHILSGEDHSSSSK
ncbi:hybrid sensor histidine kinase/response regulator [Zongyangia hominis]|uniref:hybrid sensor histidine kinase/response regulator n=1 Tax=Zongyangia hominis TaxID=2763677 RepID=UPI00292A5C67|nr:response regulator [Zongyangia hominis]